MKVYAYSNHELRLHLKGTAYRALIYLDAVNPHIICKRFSRLGLKITAEELKEVVRLSALLHDIGKASDVYQKGDYKSFYLHELPSAVIAARVLERKDTLTQEHKDLIVITVLQHMSTMRDWLSDVTPKIENIEWSFIKSSAYINDFLKNEIGYEINLNVDKQAAINIINENKRRSREFSWIKLYNLILALITAADSIDAYTVRNDNLDSTRRWFVEELMKLAKY